MSGKELYRNAPVVLVALEVRHPEAGTLTPAQQRKIKAMLADYAPIQRTGQLARIEGFLGESSSPTVRTEQFPKYLRRNGTFSVSFRSTAVVVETTSYEGWESLKPLVEHALRARETVAAVDGVERVGLRFVNEVRTLGPDGSDWEHWVDTGLLGPYQAARTLGLPVDRWQGVTVFAPASERNIVLRYGSADGYAVDPGGDLKRPTASSPGPFFLIDIDSFWTPTGDVPKFDSEQLVEVAEKLHDPVDDLFESLITERLRKEVLRSAISE